MNKDDYMEHLAMRERAIARERILYPDECSTHRLDPMSIGPDVDADGGALLPGTAHLFTPHFEIAQHIPARVMAEPAVQCSPAQNSQNEQIVAALRNRIQLLSGLGGLFDAVNATTKSGLAIAEALARYNSTAFGATFARCLPSGQTVIDTYNEWNAKNTEVNPKGIRASDQLAANATVSLTKLNELIPAVQQARQEFDSTSTGGAGVAGIVAAHAAFQAQESIVASFQLGSWWPQHDQRAAAIRKDVVDAHNREASFSAIDELDRLRDEYITSPKGRRPVPPRDQFTNSKGSAHFSFAELKASAYSWALITDRLLEALEAVRTKLGSKPLTATSGYRNPAHNDAQQDGVRNSRHQYGDAADITPSYLDGDGAIDTRDRDLLHNAATAAGFNEIIPKARVTVHMAFE